MQYEFNKRCNMRLIRDGICDVIRDVMWDGILRQNNLLMRQNNLL